MPWDTEQPVALQRSLFVAAVRDRATVSQACAHFGISRKTGHKWLARASAPAPARQPLRDRSRRPRYSPGRTPAAIEDAVLAARQRYGWGARKLHALLCRDPALVPGPVPSYSTIHRILTRRGLAGAAPKAPPQRFERSAPNELWQMDFKGPLKGCGRTRYLFSIVDDHSRFLLALRLCPDMTMATAWAVLWEAFGQAGVPLAVLSDNAFAARGFGARSEGGHGLSWLEARLERLGILFPHGRPHHPQTRGKVERYHRSLAGEALAGLDLSQPDEAIQQALDRWRGQYNEVRPHEGIGNAVPAQRWHASEVPRPATLPAVRNPAGTEPRKVQGRGEIRWRGFEITVGQGLEGEPVGVSEKDGQLSIWYGKRRLRTILSDTLAKGRFN